MNISQILTCQINGCECVSNAKALFCFDLDATTISYLHFSNGSIILFLIVLLFSNSYQFVLLNVGACHFGDTYCHEQNFILI